MEKKWKVRLKWVKTKQGLRRSPFLFFSFGRLGLYGGGRRRRKKEEEKKKKIQVWIVWNSCLELLFGTFIFVSMKLWYGFVG